MALAAIQIEERLEAIELDMARRQEEFAKAAQDYHRLTRDFELRLARVKLQTKADTETAKKDKALDAIAAGWDEYDTFRQAEGAYEGAKAAMRVLEARAMIGMALLKSHGREPSRVPSAEPRWSSGRVA